MLITKVSARPRIRSNVPRWTSSALHVTAMPFPMPLTMQPTAATQTSGLDCDPEVPERHEQETPAVHAGDAGASEHGALEKLPSTSPAPIAPKMSP